MPRTSGATSASWWPPSHWGASPPIVISLRGLVGPMLPSTPTASTLPVSLHPLGRALLALGAVRQRVRAQAGRGLLHSS